MGDLSFGYRMLAMVADELRVTLTPWQQEIVKAYFAEPPDARRARLSRMHQLYRRRRKR